MAQSKSYEPELIEALKDPEEAAEYLSAALEDRDPRAFLLALRDVSEAFGGMAKVAKRTKLNRENLYRMFSRRGNPALSSLNKVLAAFGLRLAIEIKG